MIPLVWWATWGAAGAVTGIYAALVVTASAVAQTLTGPYAILSACLYLTLHFLSRRRRRSGVRAKSRSDGPLTRA